MVPTTASKDQLRFEIPAGFQMGAIIMLIARTYATVESVIKELAQNMIDARAMRGEIILNLKDRRLTTFDDGKGASIEEMRQRINRIGARMKDAEDVGEKGIGNLSPIGIGKRYRLVSHPKGVDEKIPFFRISFDRDVVADKETVSFPCERLLACTLGKQGWTTSVAVSGIENSALRSLRHDPNPLERICDAISAAFSTKIQERGITIKVTVIDVSGFPRNQIVTPQEFEGRPEEPIIIETKQGAVRFQMYTTSRKVKNPKVMVDHQGRFSFPLEGMPEIWSEVKEIFGSGHLQGKIRVDFCELREDRQGFTWNDKLEDFIDAVTKFVKEYGEPWLQRLAETRDLDLFEEVVGGAVNDFDAIVKERPDLLSDLFRASVSNGHVNSNKAPPNSKITTWRKKKNKPTVPPLVKTEEEEEQPPEKKRRKKEKKMSHKGVSSPTGTPRRTVTGQSGIQVVHGEGIGWRVKIGTDAHEKGKIVLNTTHPDWRNSQHRGKAHLAAYVRLLMMGILSVPLIPGDRGRIFQEEFEGVVLQYRSAITPRISF